MYDLTDCSIVIPVRIDSVERLEHVHFAYNYFSRNFVNHRLIIVEQGGEPSIRLQPSSNIQIEFARNEKVFSPSEISNIGASLVKELFFCKYDADALIPPKAIFEAFEILKSKSGQSLVLPYNGVSFTIADERRKDMLRTADFSSLPFVGVKEAATARFDNVYLKCLRSTGLIHLFRTDVFKELGGYNEEFIGWGYEDTEMINRFGILGHPAAYLENYNAFHFEHPRREGDQPQVFRNYCLKQTLNAMVPEELRKNIKTWSRFV